jgi:hypothetical protein
MNCRRLKLAAIHQIKYQADVFRTSKYVTNSLNFRRIFPQFGFSKKKSEKLHFSISNSPEIRYILNSLVLRVEKLPSLSRKLKFSR